ncbi:tyrosine-type recombinase/integrase [Leifsonia aquatica]|uniref:tyrosine-type recombinase/integrase n=1 Tax=Leifsonia aquatica TaxID=144185 RepID=UPI003800DC79
MTRFRSVLSALFAWAVRERILRENPVDSVPVPRGIGTNETTEIYPFSLAELLSVYRDLRLASGRWADLALVLGLTCIRWGELMALRTRYVQQLPHASLRVSRSAPDGKSVRNSTKGGKARVVPLADRLKPIFEEWSVGRRPDDLIFATPSGNPIGGSNWKRTVRWTELGRGRRVHDLRHSAATLWLSAGIDVKTVQTWLGHASMTLTVDTYAHWMGSDADVAAVSRINGILGDEKGTSLNLN